LKKQFAQHLAALYDVCDAWPWLPYSAPFAVFAASTYLQAIVPVGDGAAYLMKTIAAGSILALFWPMLRADIEWTWDGLAILAGVGVCVVWIGLEGHYPQIGHSTFEPPTDAGPVASGISIGIRLLGASLLVPVMEEIFWRAFVMRYLVSSQFRTVPLGHVTGYAFALTAVAFGFEHHRWLPGIVAGVVYAGLLCRTRRLSSPIQAHAVTNLLLGLYVIYTEQWSFW